ncbi:MAG TPA: type II toxin-antitoxin system prevent-host-death family antitoxin [Stellaceae bacterium]|nr:type II toxin-antitoxin system prevent-host-death family antitoxin [Stellaceae bacterium]
MREIGASEAQKKLAQLLNAVERGEEVTITRHGKPVARLMRPEEGSDRVIAKPLTQRKLAELRRKAGSPALAVARDRRGTKRRFWVDGERAAGSGIAATINDHWHLGSITKSMTATLIARLVEAGAVGWDDTISDVFADTAEGVREDYRPVTFRHLLSHRSGLPSNIPMAEILKFSRDIGDPRQEREAYARIALSMPVQGPTTTTFEYSNNGYVVAGAMLERRLGRSWEELIRTHLFEPLGLRSAGFGAPGIAGRTDQPVGHAAEPNGERRAFHLGEGVTDNPVALGPAGRVHMGLGDLLTYLVAHRDRSPILSPSTWHVLHTPPFGGDYAMGWRVLPTGALRHNGSNTLWFAAAHFDSKRGVASVAAANDGHLEKSEPAVEQARHAAAV